MTKDLERAFLYGPYGWYWQFNFEEDELDNSKEAYEQILAEIIFPGS